ncbi:winged helix DNA-binding domain-containing protein [Demequina phytophila]|uniref:winged helix DNA-binding domain-containing protein n=1 Tax=Demequina phytophila TaxID=1638981 RepID=UPI000783CC5E|nr:winged helix DNA-binding domain-containing protein [Demequina phytophila]
MAAPLSAIDVRRLRLRALLLAGERGRAGDDAPAGDAGEVARVVAHLGAMQAQDVASALWSLGLRLPGTTELHLRDALARGQAIRTWPMRGTIHLVPPRDAAWMTALMSTRPRAAAAARRAQLGLDDATVERGAQVLLEALRGRRLTRAACLAALEDAGIPTDGQRGYHVIVDAAQAGAVCIVAQDGKEQVFARLDEAAPDPLRPSREDALATLARRYVQSHGPVTEADLARWTGLPLRDCRAGIAAAGEAITRVDTVAGPMLASPRVLEAGAPAERAVLAAPGFDELVLGYADRSAQLPREREAAVVPGGNGVFRSTFVRDGLVVGTWRRTVTATAVRVEAHDLAGLSARDRGRCEAALAPYGAFLERKVRAAWA